MQKNKPKINQNIMKQIESNQIQMKSKKYFNLKQIGLESILIISIAITIIAVNLSLYYFVNSEAFFSFRPGIPGLKLLIRSIPFGFIISMTVGLLIIKYIWNKFDISYKKPYNLFLPILAGIIVLIGLWLFKSGINDRIGIVRSMRSDHRLMREQNIRRGNRLDDKTRPQINGRFKYKPE